MSSIELSYVFNAIGRLILFLWFTVIVFTDYNPEYVSIICAVAMIGDIALSVLQMIVKRLRGV